MILGKKVLIQCSALVQRLLFLISSSHLKTRGMKVLLCVQTEREPNFRGNSIANKANGKWT